MAAITGVTGTVLNFRKLDSSIGSKENLVNIAYGDGTKTYPSNGIPLALNQLGLVNTLEALIFVGADNAADGYVYKFDRTHQTLRLYVTGTSANTVLNEVATSAAPTGHLTAYVRGY